MWWTSKQSMELWFEFLYWFIFLSNRNISKKLLINGQGHTSMAGYCIHYRDILRREGFPRINLIAFHFRDSPHSLLLSALAFWHPICSKQPLHKEKHLFHNILRGDNCAISHNKPAQTSPESLAKWMKVDDLEAMTLLAKRQSVWIPLPPVAGRDYFQPQTSPVFSPSKDFTLLLAFHPTKKSMMHIIKHCLVSLRYIWSFTQLYLMYQQQFHALVDGVRNFITDFTQSLDSIMYILHQGFHGHVVDHDWRHTL